MPRFAVGVCVWRLPWGVRYYPAWAALGSASITASNASPGEHDITHTYACSHRGDPHWAKFPLAPPVRQKRLYMCVSVCDPAVCPHARRLNQCSLQKVCWGLCLCQPANQSKELRPQHPHRLTGQSKGAASGKDLSPGL